jgi:hypothetical protein
MILLLLLTLASLLVTGLPNTGGKDNDQQYYRGMVLVLHGGGADWCYLFRFWFRKIYGLPSRARGWWTTPLSMKKNGAVQQTHGHHSLADVAAVDYGGYLAMRGRCPIENATLIGYFAHALMGGAILLLTILRMTFAAWMGRRRWALGDGYRGRGDVTGFMSLRCFVVTGFMTLLTSTVGMARDKHGNPARLYTGWRDSHWCMKIGDGHDGGGAGAYTGRNQTPVHHERWFDEADVAAQAGPHNCDKECPSKPAQPAIRRLSRCDMWRSCAPSPADRAGFGCCAWFRHMLLGRWRSGPDRFRFRAAENTRRAAGHCQRTAILCCCLCWRLVAMTVAARYYTVTWVGSGHGGFAQRGGADAETVAAVFETLQTGGCCRG